MQKNKKMDKPLKVFIRLFKKLTNGNQTLKILVYSILIFCFNTYIFSSAF